MQQVILETPNELDLTVPELQALARELESANDHLQVRVGTHEQRGAGVTFWDVLHFWIPEPEFMRDALYGYLIGRCQEVLRARRSGKHQEKRPMCIVVHLPDGSVAEIIEEGGELGDAPRAPRSQPRVLPPEPDDLQGQGDGFVPPA